jgi:hypothetical protein
VYKTIFTSRLRTPFGLYNLMLIVCRSLLIHTAIRDVTFMRWNRDVVWCGVGWGGIHCYITLAAFHLFCGPRESFVTFIAIMLSLEGLCFRELIISRRKLEPLRQEEQSFRIIFKKVCAVRHGVGLLVSSQIKHLLLPLEQEECKFYLNYSLYCQSGNLHHCICILLLFRNIFSWCNKAVVCVVLVPMVCFIYVTQYTAHITLSMWC